MISSEEGFSFIELMFVLGITAALVILGVGNLSSQMPHYNLAGASRQIISDLRLIRQQAITEGVSKSIRFDPKTKSYCFYVKDSCSKTEARELPSYIRFGVKQGTSKLPSGASFPPDGVSFTNDFGNNNIVTFLPNGTLEAAGSIYLTSDPSRNEAVAITGIKTGRIKTQRWNGNVWK